MYDNCLKYLIDLLNQLFKQMSLLLDFAMIYSPKISGVYIFSYFRFLGGFIRSIWGNK